MGPKYETSIYMVINFEDLNKYKILQIEGYL